MKRLLSAFVTLFLSFFGFVLLISENVLATYQPPAVNPNLDSVTEYICYSQASGVNAAWSIIYKKSDFNCGGIPAGINFYPDYGVKVGCTGNGSNIATGGSYDIYSYYSNSWHKDDWSGYGAVNNANSLDSQIACSVDLPASYPGFVFQGSYYSYGQTIMQANYTPPSSQQQLYITRSLELGGGVIITVPPGFPEYQCGLNSYEDCEFEDLPYNSQVTLEAQANSGYAFSHWEINSQTMEDTDGEITIAMSENKEVKAVFNNLAYSPIRPVNGIIELDYDVDVSWRVDNHNGIDYDSDLSNPVKSVGKGTVYGVNEYTKPYSESFGAIDPDEDGPTIWIKHRLSSGEPIYVLYGHTASSWNNQSTGSGESFVFNCTYVVSVNGVVNAGQQIGYTAPFYHSGYAQPHLHLSVFKPYQKIDGSYYGPPSSGWGYSGLVLLTGEFIDPEDFFANYQLTDNLD